MINALTFLITTAVSPAILVIKTTEQYLGSGIIVDIPAKWEFKSYPMPVADATNYRITTEKLRMAITGMKKPKGEKLTLPGGYTISPEQMIKFNVANASMPYLIAGGQDADPKQESLLKGDGYIGAFSTVTAPNDEPLFEVFPGRKYACATTANIEVGDILYIISIGSDSCTGNNHQAALDILKSFKVSGR